MPCVSSVRRTTPSPIRMAATRAAVSAGRPQVGPLPDPGPARATQRHTCRDKGVEPSARGFVWRGRDTGGSPTASFPPSGGGVDPRDGRV